MTLETAVVYALKSVIHIPWYRMSQDHLLEKGLEEFRKCLKDVDE